MNYAAANQAANGAGLAVLGGFHPTAADMAPQHCKTILMLGPQEPGFWPTLTASPEYTDGQPNPVDRWSTRVIGQLAQDLHATAVFPFGGPPYQPFVRWALKTGRVWSSPVDLLVHDTAGLFLSFRGALAFETTLNLPEPPAQSPCTTCETRPCLTDCPPRALTGAGYDVDNCHTFLRTPPGQACMQNGCAVRRACPVSQSYGRLKEQSAHHMRAFHKR